MIKLTLIFIITIILVAGVIAYNEYRHNENRSN